VTIKTEKIITIQQAMPAPISCASGLKKAELRGFIGSLNDILISGCLL
jgi:hypothetical protein